MMAFGISKIRGWFAFLFPPLLLYWFTTSNKPVSIYNIYEINSVCGACWLILIIWGFLFIYQIMMMILAKILYFAGLPLKRDSVLLKFATLADKLNGLIMSFLWLFVIIFGYSWSFNYVPLKPIIMKMFSYFSMISFINYYQLTLLCNSDISWAIKYIMGLIGL